jgi:uracil-DNA glycosylase family 4
VSSDEELHAVATEVRACKACKLHRSRKNAVPGEGPASSDLMFIGEGPGFHENEQGRPFVGAAGKYLEELLASIGLQREQVFIGNVVKCRPPGNRDPLPEEIQACSAFLERQMEAIQPKVIVTLGRFSMARFFPSARISDIHGHARMVNGRMIVAMYHPAAALHQPSLRRDVEADFANLPALIRRAAPEPEPPADSETAKPPQQLSLF